MNNPPPQQLAPPPLSLPPSFGAAMFDDAAEYETASIASNSTVSTIMTTSTVDDDIAVAEFEFEHPNTVVLKCFKNHYESSCYVGHRGGGGIHPITAHILIENLPFIDPSHKLQETSTPLQDEDPWQQQQQQQQPTYHSLQTFDVPSDCVDVSAYPLSFLNGPARLMSRGDALPTTFKTTTTLNNKRPFAYSVAYAPVAANNAVAYAPVVHTPAAAKRNHAHVSGDPSTQQGQGGEVQGQSIQAYKSNYFFSVPNPLQPRSVQRKMDEGVAVVSLPLSLSSSHVWWSHLYTIQEILTKLDRAPSVCSYV